MNKDELFLKIIYLIITIIAGLVSAYVIPWIKSKMTENQLEELQKYAEIAVRCAEQIFKEDEYKAKKEYVLNYLSGIISTKLSLNVTPEDLNNLIEATVNSVKYSGGYDR